MYEAMKHLHLLAIALSVLLLTLRYILLMANSSLLQKKVLKVTPHVVDTILVATGVALILLQDFIHLLRVVSG